MLETDSGPRVLQTNSDTSQSDIDFDSSALCSQSDYTESDHSDSRTYRKFHAEIPNLLPVKLGIRIRMHGVLLMSKYYISCLS